MMRTKEEIELDIQWEKQSLSQAVVDYHNRLLEAKSTQTESNEWGNLAANMAQGIAKDRAEEIYDEERSRINARIAELQDELDEALNP